VPSRFEQLVKHLGSGVLEVRGQTRQDVGDTVARRLEADEGLADANEVLVGDGGASGDRRVAGDEVTKQLDETGGVASSVVHSTVEAATRSNEGLGSGFTLVAGCRVRQGLGRRTASVDQRRNARIGRLHMS
jgi:hypothetical protein